MPNAPVEIRFARDHTFIIIYGAEVTTGTWQVDGDQVVMSQCAVVPLVSYENNKPQHVESASIELIDSCTTRMRSDELVFTGCSSISKRDGQDISGKARLACLAKPSTNARDEVAESTA